MKNFKSKLIAVFSCCAFILIATIVPLKAEEEFLTINISVPSDNETTIASGRSFYVIGTFSGKNVLPENATVNVQILRNNFVYRNIETNINANKSLNINIPELRYYGKNRNELINSGMPDLIWDGVNPQSMFRGTDKCYYDNNGFAALIPGGVADLDIDDGLQLLNSFKQPYLPLSKGEYAINVTVKDEQNTVLANAIKKIRIDSTPHKILARFSPATHLQRVKDFAAENGYRLYLDPFPGYWSKGDLFCELLATWRASDALEYLTGKTHFIVYNIKSTSSSYQVELPILQREGLIDDSQRLAVYYYSYGEPTLPDGTVSSFQQFDLKDKLQITRIETTTQSTVDGVYNQDKPTAERYDFNLSNGVNAAPGEIVSVYGVAAPIQLAAKDIIDNKDNSYTLKNKIASIKYTLNAPRIRKLEFEKPLNLTRISRDWKNPSEMEFKHDIAIKPDYAGKVLTITMEGYDSHGKKVKGTDEKFIINVSETK